MRLVWFTAGALALALGVIGIVVPLLPTTPLVILAAFCFARSSPRVERWLLDHPQLGPSIHDWRREGAISRKGKRMALVAIAVAFGISVVLQLPWHVLAIQAVTLGAVSWFILSRPTPLDP